MEGLGRPPAAHMPVARVVNLTKAIESMKERGYYAVALDGGGDALVGETSFETDPLIVVLGSEGKGVSRLVREACDAVAGHPDLRHGRVAQCLRGRGYQPVRGPPAPAARPPRTDGRDTTVRKYENGEGPRWSALPGISRTRYR